jgi:hypothetical protein
MKVGRKRRASANVSARVVLLCGECVSRRDKYMTVIKHIELTRWGRAITKLVIIWVLQLNRAELLSNRPSFNPLLDLRQLAGKRTNVFFH